MHKDSQKKNAIDCNALDAKMLRMQRIEVDEHCALKEFGCTEGGVGVGGGGL